MPRTITFVKHARPEKLEGVDSHQWPLSEAGRADAARLAGILRERQHTAPYASPFVAVVSSDEPKAAETARIIAEGLGVPHSIHPGLHEHDRSTVPLMRTADFVSAIANFFRRPTQLVLGEETARQALKRFERAVDEVLAAHPVTADGEAAAPESAPSGNLILVAHGTVISLWLEAYAQLDGYETWRQMGLPSFISIVWPDCDIVDRNDRI